MVSSTQNYVLRRLVIDPNEVLSDSEPIPKLQRRTVHPDSLKFMDMAKDLPDNPDIRQAIEGEQQNQKTLLVGWAAHPTTTDGFLRIRQCILCSLYWIHVGIST